MGEEKAKNPKGLNCSWVLNIRQHIIFKTDAFQELAKHLQDGKLNMQSNPDSFFFSTTVVPTSCCDDVMVHK